MAYYRFTSPDDPAAEPWGSCEVFYADARDAFLARLETWQHYGQAFSDIDDPDYMGTPWKGWYWQACFPGCLPDSAPCGPFATEEEAMADAGVCDV